MLLASLCSTELLLLVSDADDDMDCSPKAALARGIGAVPTMSGASKERTLVEEIKLMGPEI